MKIELTDAEVKQAICDWIEENTSIASAKPEMVRRLYLDGSGGFEALVELPEHAN